MTSAINLVGESVNSTEAIFLCAKSPTSPGQPQYISSNQNSITITWEATDDNGGSSVLNYRIYSKLVSQSE